MMLVLAAELMHNEPTLGHVYDEFNSKEPVLRPGVAIGTSLASYMPEKYTAEEVFKRQKIIKDGVVIAFRRYVTTNATVKSRAALDYLESYADCIEYAISLDGEKTLEGLLGRMKQADTKDYTAVV